jgi:tripartite-type tricarboxylate transporter receptor subunit TctC
VPATNLRELIAYAKANPGKLTYSSSGSGTALHMAGEVFASVAGVNIQHIPYKAAAPAVTDLLGGQVSMMFDSVANSGPHIRSGKLRGIAVMGAERATALPDLPTTAELGIPAMRTYNFIGIYAPAGTPADVVDRLTKILRTALVEPDTRSFYESAGMPPNPIFGPEITQASGQQRKDLADVVRKANLQFPD